MSPSTTNKSEHGFTLLEVTMAFSVLVLLMLAIVSSLTSSHQANASTLESELAFTAAQDLAERIQGTKFPTDDTFGQEILNSYPNGTVYDSNTLDSLGRLPDKADGNPADATIRFLNEAEAAQEYGLGGFLDLNDNGADDNLILNDYNFYMAEITVTWANRRGVSVDQSNVQDRTVVLPVTIYRKQG